MAHRLKASAVILSLKCQGEMRIISLCEAFDYVK